MASLRAHAGPSPPALRGQGAARGQHLPFSGCRDLCRSACHRNAGALAMVVTLLWAVALLEDAMGSP